MTVMIDDSPTTNGGKRRFTSLDLACTAGTKRSKVFSYYPSVANHRLDGYQTIMPTADDYANLVFCSSDDEEDETLVEQPFAKKRQDKKRRRVSFGAFIPTMHQLYDTPLASDMTPDEKTNLWLNSKDIEELKMSANRAIQDMRDLVVGSHTFKKRTTFRALMAKLEEDKDTSIRGLEHRVFRRKVPRQVLVEEVLECQKHIQGLCKFGHYISQEQQMTLLANVSSKRSFSASKMALLNAKHDYFDGCIKDKEDSISL